MIALTRTPFSFENASGRGPKASKALAKDKDGEIFRGGTGYSKKIAEQKTGAEVKKEGTTSGSSSKLISSARGADIQFLLR